MANKKLLICAAIAAGLLLTACVKKETPKEEEQDKVETAVSEPQPQKPAKFESLESVDTQEAQVQEQPQVVKFIVKKLLTRQLKFAVKLVLRVLMNLHRHKLLNNLNLKHQK